MTETTLTVRPQGQKSPWDCAYIKKKKSAWLDRTFLLPFSLPEDDLKSCCGANNSSQIKIVKKSFLFLNHFYGYLKLLQTIASALYHSLFNISKYNPSPL